MGVYFYFLSTVELSGQQMPALCDFKENCPAQQFRKLLVFILEDKIHSGLFFTENMYSDLSLNNSKSLDQTSGKIGNFRYIYAIGYYCLVGEGVMQITNEF